MRIQSQEVKTIYSIEITWDDFKEAFDLWVDSPLKDVGGYKGAFDCGMNPRKEGSLIAMQELFQNLQFRSSGTPTIKFIIEQFFEFDGVDNYGHYKANCESHVCSVYNRGDCVNQ